jgi:Lipid A 3-O-deacylase (PagL)
VLPAQGAATGDAPAPDAPSRMQRLARSVGAFEMWAGAANNSPQLGIFGEAPGMRFAILAFRWSSALTPPVAVGALPSLEWTMDFIPMARMSPPLVSLRGTGQPCTTAELCVAPPDPRDRETWFPTGAPYGVGITPVGVVKRFRTTSKASPFIAINGGALIFDQRVPTTQASHFNFTASAELGLRFGPPTERGITLSYRFHHISNAGTAGENPGLASHLITVGVHRPNARPDTSRARP